MSEQLEASDEERGRLAEVVLAAWGGWPDEMDEIHPAITIAVAVSAAGYRKVEVTADEREARIERVLKVTDDMRSGGWHSGKTVAEMGQKIYDILTESMEGVRTDGAHPLPHPRA